MRKFVIQSILLIAVVGIALFVFTGNPSISNLLFFSKNSTSRQLQIGEAMLKVEIADTQSKRNKGLGGRQSIASDEGMLFVFSDLGKHPFWMKGLKFPLDFIWIRGDTVVDLTQDAPLATAGQPDSALPIYQSKEDVDKVLEINAGIIQRLNIQVGDTVKLL